MAKKVKNANGQGSYSRMKDGRIKWKQMIDGQERQITGKTQQELQEKIKKIADLPIIKNKTKVDEWFVKWLENYIKPLKSKATYDQYRFLYDKHIKPVIGNRKLTTIKRFDIQSVITEMNQKGLAESTMKHARKVMNISFTRAFKDKLIAENPVNEIEVPNKQAKERKTLSTDELIKLFSQLGKSRWKWAFKFLLVTGLRRGEILALQWQNIDFINRQITVCSSNGKNGIGDTKGRKIHYVPLTEKAIYYLNQQKIMLIEEPNPILQNEDQNKNDLIFPNENGEMMRGDSFLNVIVRAGDKVDVHVSPHMFRHTFVFMSKGILSIKELQEALGHDESTSTLDIYGTMLSDREEMAKKLNTKFNELDEQINKIEKIQNNNIIDIFEYNQNKKKAK